MTAQRRQCELFLTEGRIEDAEQVLHEISKRFDEEIRTNEATAEWVTGGYTAMCEWGRCRLRAFADLKEKCVNMLEELGDAALTIGKHDEAIARYSSALSLKPSNPIDILLKRSKLRTSKGLWADALTDANEVRP